MPATQSSPEVGTAQKKKMIIVSKTRSSAPDFLIFKNLAPVVQIVETLAALHIKDSSVSTKQLLKLTQNFASKTTKFYAKDPKKMNVLVANKIPHVRTEDVNSGAAIAQNRIDQFAHK